MVSEGSVLILSGHGRYADPWHPYAQTSECLADIATEAGIATVEIADDIDDRLSELGGVDLLIVNAGDTRRNVGASTKPLDPDSVRAATAEIGRYLNGGGAVLAMHAAASSLSDYPLLQQAIGVQWVDKQSWHPTRGLSSVDVTAEGRSHPILEGVSSFVLYDERYTDLQIDSRAHILATHDLAGNAHPILVQMPNSRRLYDALGHDGRSYEDPTHRLILRRAMRWLVHHRCFP
ncbi:hypothetical protein GCM10027403_21660 [Arthrobacter tecti]